MATPTDMAEQQDRALSGLLTLGMDLSRDVAARAKAAETAKDAEALALAFDRIARSVRLTIALQNRLTRDRQQLQRDVRADVAEAADLRRKQVRAAIARDLRTEIESENERFRLLNRVNERLQEDALEASFVEGPIEACIARIRQGLGLPPEPPANDPQPQDLEAARRPARPGPS